MSQIMRLRRRAGADHDIDDRNNGQRHEKRVRRTSCATTACCTRPSCCRAPTAATRGSPSSRPSAALELIDSLPVIAKALLRRKVTPGKALLRPQDPQGRPQGGQADLRRRRGPRRALRAEPVRHRRRRGRRATARRRRRRRRAPARGGATDEGRLLARLRQPRLHPRAARLDGARSRRCWTSSSSSSTARPAAAPASSPSTTRSSPTRSTRARSRSPSRSRAPS